MVGSEQLGTGPRAVALGGGHGLAASLSALRRVTGDLTAIVTVADDGGSSGRLRRDYGVLPPGDLRMALAALCGDDEWGTTWSKVVQHRFGGDRELAGHAVGNLLIVALWDLLDDPVAGLEWVGRLLGTGGRVLPMAAVPLDIVAEVVGADPDSSCGAAIHTSGGYSTGASSVRAACHARKSSKVAVDRANPAIGNFAAGTAIVSSSKYQRADGIVAQSVHLPSVRRKPLAG